MVERRQKLNKAERKLVGLLGRYPTIEEIAAEAQLTVEQAVEARDSAEVVASLNSPVGEEEETELGELLADPNATQTDNDAAKSMRNETLKKALEALPEREREILQLRYGLLDEKPKSLEEVGKRYGLTRERIRQIENGALKRLRELREAQPLRDAVEDD
jgi:RNA polymerase primary sigma factor